MGDQNIAVLLPPRQRSETRTTRYNMISYVWLNTYLQALRLLHIQAKRYPRLFNSKFYNAMAYMFKLMCQNTFPSLN